MNRNNSKRYEKQKRIEELKKAMKKHRKNQRAISKYVDNMLCKTGILIPVDFKLIKKKPSRKYPCRLITGEELDGA